MATGIHNNAIAADAELDALKIAPKSTAPTVDADTTALTEGRFYIDTSTSADPKLKAYNGTAFVTLAQASANTGSLDDAAQLNPKIARPIEIEQTNASAKLLVIDQNGNGGCMTLENAGTGNDITGPAWSVSVGGVVTSAGLTMVDAKPITLGTGSDAVMQFDGATLLLTTATDDVVWEIGDSAATQLSWDVKWYGNGANGADYLYFDASANLVYTTGVDLQFKDNDVLAIGTGTGAAGDISIVHDGTNMIVKTAADDTLIELGDSAATQLSVDLKWYGNSANGADYLYFDASANLLYTTGIDIQVKDSDFLVLGSGAGAAGDVSITWDTAKLVIATVADNSAIYFGDGTTNLDLRWYGGDASHYVAFDNDGNTYGIWDFGASGNGIDVRFYGDTAGAYVHWDESANQLVLIGGAQMSFNDAVELLFGTGTSNAGDITIAYTGATNVLNIGQVAAGTGSITIGADDAGLDVTFYGDTASAYAMWDTSADQLLLAGGAQISLNDSVELLFGTGTANAGDFAITGTSAPALAITQIASGTGTITIGADNKGIDVTFYAEAASAYMLWDQNYNTNGGLVLEGVDLGVNDDDILIFGDDKDFQFRYDSTDTRLEIDATAANGVIRFGSTVDTDVVFEGTTSTTSMAWDASADGLVFANGTATFTLSFATNALQLAGETDDRVIILGTSTLRTDVKFWAGDGDASAFIYLDASADTNNGSWAFGQDDHGIDVILYGATASMNVTWDQSANEMLWSGGATPAMLRLPDCTLAQMDAISATGTAGQLAYISNGAAGSPCLGVSKGDNWYQVAIGNACASV